METKGWVVSKFVLITSLLVLVFSLIIALPLISSSQEEAGQLKTQTIKEERINLTKGEYISPVFELKNPTDSIGLKYNLLNPDIEPKIYIRAYQADGWTGWLETEEKDRDEVPNIKAKQVAKNLSQGVKYSDLIFFNQATKVQYRTDLSVNFDGQVFQELKLVTIGQEELNLLSKIKNRLGSIFIKEANSSVNVIDRASWVARKADGSRKNWAKNAYVYDNWPLKYQDPNKIIVHHDGNASGLVPKSETEAKTWLKNIHYYHAVSLGWGDIGYNYVIDPWGNIYHGRLGDNGVIGGHALGRNSGSIGVLVLGNYQSNRPSTKALNALAEFSGYRSYQNGIDTSTRIYGHKDMKYFSKNLNRWVNATACPGSYLYSKLGSVRNSAGVYKQAYGGNWPDGSLLSPTDSGTIFVTENGRRLAILSNDVFDQWGYKKSKIKQLSSEVIKEINYGGLRVYKQNTLIKAEGKGTIWVIDEGKRKYISSYSILQAKGWEDKNIRIIRLKKLKKIPYGGKYKLDSDQSSIDKTEIDDNSSSSKAYNNGELIRRSSGGTVYRIKANENVKRPILSPDVFRAYRYNWNNIKEVKDSIVDNIPTGEMIVYKNGTLLTTKTSSTVWVIDRPYRKYIPNSTILKDYGGISRVKTINNKKLQRIPYGGRI
jgi:hypothetical protein